LKPLLIAVVGATATGKTDAAIALCKRLGGEAISMDAMQIYQGLSIGTARPEPEALGVVPHHMIAAVPPDEKFSVAAYAQRVLPLIEELRARGKQPVLVGGTGLYLDAIQWPLRFASAPEDAALRERLMGEEAEALHGRLRSLDPRSAERLPVGDKRRVVRALEIVLNTGTPMSEAQDERQGRFDLLLLGLTLPREALYARINRRVEAMFENGLEAEVAFLLRYGLSPQAQSMQAIGYKETVRFLQGQYSRQEAVEAIQLGTRRYAKRQGTWLRKYEGIRWFDVSAYPSPEALHRALHEAVLEHQALRKDGSNHVSN